MIFQQPNVGVDKFTVERRSKLLPYFLLLETVIFDDNFFDTKNSDISNTFPTFQQDFKLLLMLLKYIDLFIHKKTVFDRRK